LFDEVVGEGVLHELQGFIEEELGFDAGVLLFDDAITASDDIDVLTDVADVEETGLDTVVKIGGEIGDFVGEVDELGLQRRTLIEEVFGELGMLGDAVVAGVLDDSLANAEGEIEAAMGGVALLEVLDDAEGMQIVVEGSTVAAEASVESALACVSEGRVSDVMDEGEGFGEVFVQTEGGGSGAGDLGDLDGVGEAAAKVVRGSAGEDLGFAGEPTEGASLNDALPIPLDGRAGGTIGRGIDARQKRVVGVANNGAGVKVGCHGQVQV